MKSVKLRRNKKLNENIGNVFANMPNEYSNFSPYSYEVLSFNHNLEQKGNDLNVDRYISTGSYIEGYGFTDRETVHRGVVRSIVKDEMGYIKYIVILDSKITKFVKIYPYDVKILK